jgi:flagellar hook-length control protein FliK
MIPVSILPSPSADGAAAGALTCGDAAATPFDAILSLEALAATCAALDPAASGGVAVEGDLEDLTMSEGDDRDGDEGDADAQGPLAFLASLFSLAPPAPAAPRTEAGDGADSGEAGSDDAIELTLSNGRHAVAVDPADMPTAQAGTQAVATAVDLALAGKVIDAAAAAPNADGGKDATQAADPTAGAARAAEWMNHAPRHATAANARDGIMTPVRDPRWADELGTRVAMMVRGAESSASLQLTPVDLGPLDVSVTVRDSQASIHFGAANAETRALLEASIPRLREMLAAQGFNLLDASVSQGFARSGRPDARASLRGDVEPEVEAVTEARIVANGLLDTYA